MNKTDGLSNARLSRDLPVKRNSRVENENLFHGRGRAPPPHTHTHEFSGSGGNKYFFPGSWWA